MHMLCTNEFSRLVLSPVDDRLKGLPHDVREAVSALEGLRDDAVHLALQLQQVLHHRSVSLHVIHDSCTRFLQAIDATEYTVKSGSS